MSFLLESGQSSGDPHHSSGTFTQASLHPDHNVGIVLYDLVLRQRAAGLAARAGATLPWVLGEAARGGVTNSAYVMPSVRLTPLDFLVLKLAVLSAWVSRQDGLLYPRGRSKYLGTELDLGVDFIWGVGADDLPHVFLRIEGGYLLFGGQIAPDYESPGSFALRTRLAFVL